MGLGAITGVFLTAAGSFVAKQLGAWVSKKMQERKWAKEYKLSEPTAASAPAPIFAPASPDPPVSQEIELRRTRVKLVLLDTELGAAEQATHNLRTLLDQARREIAEKTSELVATRQLYDELKQKYDELEKKSLDLKKEYETFRTGEKDAIRDDSNAPRRDGRHFGGEPAIRGLPPPPNLQGRRKGR